MMSFFNREAELAELHEIAARSEEVAQFTVVTGRRRVGKTSLVLKSLENETFVYLFVERKSEKDLCKSDARINLIVSGSVNTLMVKLFRNKKAPLYGRLLGCLILDLVQKGPDIYGSVYDVRYLYGELYGVNGESKSTTNSVRYFDAKVDMSKGHAVFNFSLKDLKLVLKKSEE